jgi:hypothetical protein
MLTAIRHSVNNKKLAANSIGNGVAFGLRRPAPLQQIIEKVFHGLKRLLKKAISDSAPCGHGSVDC